jgi:hypothetical protein
MPVSTRTLAVGDAVIDIREDGSWRVRWSANAKHGSGWVTTSPAPKDVDDALMQLLNSRGREGSLEHAEDALAKAQSEFARRSVIHRDTIRRLERKVAARRAANRRDSNELNRLRGLVSDLADRLDAARGVGFSPGALVTQLRQIAVPTPRRQAPPLSKPVVFTTDLDAGREWAAQMWPALNVIAHVAVLTPCNVRAIAGQTLTEGRVFWHERAGDPQQFTDADREFVASRIR